MTFRSRSAAEQFITTRRMSGEDWRIDEVRREVSPRRGYREYFLVNKYEPGGGELAVRPHFLGSTYLDTGGRRAAEAHGERPSVPRAEELAEIHERATSFLRSLYGQNTLSLTEAWRQAEQRLSTGRIAVPPVIGDVVRVHDSVVIATDYSQIEARALAHLTPPMLETLDLSFQLERVNQAILDQWHQRMVERGEEASLQNVPGHNPATWAETWQVIGAWIGVREANSAVTRPEFATLQYLFTKGLERELQRQADAITRRYVGTFIHDAGLRLIEMELSQAAEQVGLGCVDVRLSEEAGHINIDMRLYEDKFSQALARMTPSELLDRARALRLNVPFEDLQDVVIVEAPPAIPSPMEAVRRIASETTVASGPRVTRQARKLSGG